MSRQLGQKPSAVDSRDWSALQSALGSSIGGGISPAQLASADPQALGNDPKMELEWAEKAGKHAETYYKLLTAFSDKRKLRLTSIDDRLLKHFRECFPDFNVNKIDENCMKNESGKALWRPFLMKYEKDSGVQDYNFGTLLRLDASKDYEPDNVTVVPRIQFLAIEIARNREGANDDIGKNNKK
jgi:hypothetical protein